jgi:hypothetical protein
MGRAGRGCTDTAGCPDRRTGNAKCARLVADNDELGGEAPFLWPGFLLVPLGLSEECGWRA